MNAPFNPRALLAETPAPVAATGPVERRATPAATPQDWEQLVTPGHVLGQRLVRAGRVAFAVALSAFCLSAGLVAAFATGKGSEIIRALPLPNFNIPAGVSNALTYDPATYVDLGAGQRADYRLAWLGNIPKVKGLSETEWLDLNMAALADLRSHGFIIDRYSAIPALAVRPMVTRPEKALTEHVTRLATGIITIPAQGQPMRVHVAAMVNGAWAWTVFESNIRCSTFGTALVPSCAALTSPSPMFNDLRPAPSK